MQKGRRVKVTREARERKQGRTRKMREEMGEGYRGKREIEHESEKQENGKAKEKKNKTKQG